MSSRVAEPGVRTSATTTSSLSESDVLIEFFRYLTNRGVPYAVVGDVRDFPSRISGDVDIVLKAEHVRQLNSLLKEFAANNGLKIVQQLQHESCAFYTCLVWTSMTGSHLLKIDVSSDYLRAGRLIISSAAVVDRAVKHYFGPHGDEYFYVPSIDVAMAYYLAKRVDKQDLSFRNLQYLRSLWSSNRDLASAGFLSIWHESDLAVFQRVLFGDVPDVDDVKVLRTRLHENRPRRWGSSLAEICRRCHRILRPTGLLVAVLGADGSGKSTLIQNLQRDVGGAFRRSHYQHLRPRLFSADPPSGFVNTAPHAQPCYGKAKSILKLSFLVWDFMAGYVAKTWPALVRSTFCISDRYYHDLLVDPIRYRYGASLFFARWLARFVPRPDLMFVLDAPSEVILARKTEVSADECERQVAAYRALADCWPFVKTLNATLPADDVADQARFLIFEHMAAKMERRLG